MHFQEEHRRETGLKSSLASLSHISDQTGRERLRRGRYLVLLAVILAGLVAFGSLTLLSGKGRTLAASPDDAIQKLDRALYERLQLAAEDDRVRVIIHMREQAPVQLDDLPSDIVEKRLEVAGRLQQSAATARIEIERQLNDYKTQNRVTEYRPLWIINGIQATAASDVIASLANRPDVAQITLDTRIKMLSPITLSEGALPPGTLPPDSPWGLAQTRVHHVWAGLGISGTGATIAVMDTGVDWQHPALLSSYRGLTPGGPPDHQANWFDAVEGELEPIDPHGHGTHVAGTASGRYGIGVAPGSKWIAVRILGADGYGYEGDIHAGFQWLLAPGGDPSLAPDIVNGSWSSAPGSDAFLTDISALQAAGIITVFAAGNTGPERGSVRAPANYPDVVAVGASDDIDQLAWFSSRGPSMLTQQRKPVVVAPGTHILSSVPGGGYGYASGTSMAAPHVAGLYALILSARDQISAAEATTILTTTAQLDDGAQPDENYGWGRADAYSAIASIVDVGNMEGVVNGAGLPLPGAAITITTPGEAHLGFTSGPLGTFSAELIAGEYQLMVSAYGYESYLSPTVVISDGISTGAIVNLERLPHGTLSGRLLDLQTGLPLSGTVRVNGSPLTVSVGSDGHYEVSLPAGEHELVAWVGGHRLGRLIHFVTAGETFAHDFLLESAPTILLIDSGQWYGASELNTYSKALQDIGYAHSTLSVRDPFLDRPTLDLYSQYEIIIYSAPKDSPGYLGVGKSLSEYLDSGGKVLIAGQDVAELDEHTLFFERWWQQQLRGVYLGDSAPPFELVGEQGTLYDGLQLSLTEYDRDGVAVDPDASEPQYRALTEVALTYSDGTAAALLAGQCEPFRLAYFGFGLQEVESSAVRNDLLATTFDFFDLPETEVGVRFEKAEIEELVPSSASRTYPIELFNLSETLTDTFRLELADASWPARIVTDTLELGPCESGTSVIEVDIPGNLPLDTVESLELVATSNNFPDYQNSLPIRLKTPGHILLVDDDRWYDQAPAFKTAMQTAGFEFDFWDTDVNLFNSVGPPSDLLNAYDFVVWYTGYDWFKPITADESVTLQQYLEQGGRLFLTSQDYLYYHFDEPLTRDYLGVLQYWESVTPTLTYGGSRRSPFAEMAGPLPLDFGRYQNHADGLVPKSESIVSLWHDQGFAAGIGSSGPDWRSVFWGLPLETLPASSQAKSMNRILGWLSDLGESSFLVDSRAAVPGDRRTYTLTLRYSPAGPGSHVMITNSLPISLHIDPASLTGGADYDLGQQQITWQGYMAPGQNHEITYEATTPRHPPPGARVENVLEIYYEDHDLTLERTVPFWLTAPDASASRLLVTPTVAQPGQAVTYELQLVNQGNTAGLVNAEVKLHGDLSPLTNTVRASQGEVRFSGRRLTWNGWLQPGQSVTASVVLTAPNSARPSWLPATAVIDDGTTDPVILDSLLAFEPHAAYLPVIANGER